MPTTPDHRTMSQRGTLRHTNEPHTDIREQVNVLLHFSDVSCESDNGYARECAQAALNLAAATDDTVLIAECRFMLAEVLNMGGEYAEALNHITAAIEVFRRNDVRPRLITALSTLGHLYLKTGRAEDAEASFNAALAMAEEQKDNVKIVHALNSLARIRFHLGYLHSALDSLQRSLKLCRAMKLEYQLGSIHNNIASVLRKLQEPEKALEHAYEALKWYQKCSHNAGAARAARIIGTIYVSLDRLEEGLQYLTTAQREFERCNLKDMQAEVLMEIGEVSFKQRRYTEAAGHCREVLKLASVTGNVLNQGAAYLSLGAIYLQRRIYRQAIRSLQRAISIAEQAGDLQLECDAYDTLRRVYGQMNETVEAERIGRIHLYKKNLLAERNRPVPDAARQSPPNTAAPKEAHSENREEQRLNDIIRELDNRLQAAGRTEGRDEDLYNGYSHFYKHLFGSCPTLTPTELKVCGLVRSGLSSKEISAALFISVRTVEIHRGKIRKKLELPRRVSLASYLMSL